MEKDGIIPRGKTVADSDTASILSAAPKTRIHGSAIEGRFAPAHRNEHSPSILAKLDDGDTESVSGFGRAAATSLGPSRRPRLHPQQAGAFHPHARHRTVALFGPERRSMNSAMSQ
jgi:hypothetical protein